MSKIYEREIKRQMIKLLKDIKRENMNQFKFEDDFFEQIETIFEKENTDEKIETSNTEILDKDEINLMDYNKIFNS